MRDTVELTRDDIRLIMLALHKAEFTDDEEKSIVDEGSTAAAWDLHDQLASLGFSRFEGHREGLKVTLEVRDA